MSTMLRALLGRGAVVLAFGGVSAFFAMQSVFFAACDSGGSSGTLEEASDGGFELLTDDSGRVIAVRGRFSAGSGTVEARSRDFVERHADELGLPDGAELGSAVELTEGLLTAVVFDVQANGVPFNRAEVRLVQLPDTIVYLSLNVPRALPDETTPTVEASAAEVAVTSANPEMTLEGEPELMIFAPSLFFGGDPQPRLAWRVLAADTDTAPEFFVDALDGSILGRLERRVTEMNRTVIDWNGFNHPDQEVVVYAESGPLVDHIEEFEEATLAYRYAKVGCDYLWDRFEEDGPCRELKMYSRRGREGTACQQSGVLHFGLGDLADEGEGERTFLHEFGHAWHYTSVGGGDGPVGTGEPGAVGEAIADIVSMLALQPAQWIVDPGHRFERDLENPSFNEGVREGNPGHYGELLPPWDGYDAGHVHENSVILSHGIWRATIAGVTVGEEQAEGIGYSDMEQILNLFLRIYVGHATDLHQAASHLIDACNVFPLMDDVFGVPARGVTYRDCGVLVNALASVGLSEADNDLDGLPNTADNCPDVYNPGQDNTNDGPFGDACESEDQPDAGPVGLDDVRCPEEWLVRDCPDLRCQIYGGAPCEDATVPTTWPLSIDTTATFPQNVPIERDSSYYIMYCPYQRPYDDCRALFMVTFDVSVDAGVDGVAGQACNFPGEVVESTGYVYSGTRRVAVHVPSFGSDTIWNEDEVTMARQIIDIVDQAAALCE